MGASTQKKLRQEAREAGYDKRKQREEEAAQKAKKNRLRITIAIIAVVLFIAVTLFLNSSFMYTTTTAVTVGDSSFSPADVNYNYGNQYLSFVNNYGSYASVFGLDTTYGLSGLSSQEYTMDESVGTWRDYFLDEAVNELKQVTALCDYANKNGIVLEDSDLEAIDTSFASLKEQVSSYGYPSMDKFFNSNYGKGVSEKVAKNMETASALAQKAYLVLFDEATASDKDFKDYKMKNVRHILVKADVSSDGTYTDAALEKAKAAAEDILAEWKAGPATEDSFSELAKERSEDTGSSNNGGLYENVYKGQMVEEFENFLYDPAVKPGDTGIVFGQSASYAGYHVMYFVGDGDMYSSSSARSAEVAELVSPVIEELTSALDVKFGKTINLVGKS